MHEATGGYPRLTAIVEFLQRLRNDYDSFIIGDVLLAMPKKVWRNVQISDIVSATTALRLCSDDTEETAELESAVAKAADAERETIMALPGFYQDSFKYGIGGHFFYWRALLHEADGSIELARADFDLARSCGVVVPKRKWEK